MDKVLKLASLVKASGSLEFNPHKAYYEDAKTYFAPNEHIDREVIGVMDWSEDVWELQVYPRTPVSFVLGISNDLEALLDWGIAACR